MDVTYFEGQLQQESNNLLKTKKKRYFVLKIDGLYAYKDKNKRDECLARIDFSEVIDIVRFKKKSNTCFCINVNVGSKPTPNYYFCDSEKEMDDWISTLESALISFKRQPEFFRNSMSVTLDRNRAPVVPNARNSMTPNLRRTSLHRSARIPENTALTLSDFQAGLESAMLTFRIGVISTDSEQAKSMIQTSMRAFKFLNNPNGSVHSPSTTPLNSPKIHVDSSSLSDSTTDSPVSPMDKRKSITKSYRMSFDSHGVDYSSLIKEYSKVKYNFGDNSLDLEIVNVSDDEGLSGPLAGEIIKCEGIIIVYDAFDTSSFSHAVVLYNLIKSIKRMNIVFAGNVIRNQNSMYYNRRRIKSMAFKQPLDEGIETHSLTPYQNMSVPSLHLGNLSTDSPITQCLTKNDNPVDPYDQIKKQIKDLGREILTCDISTSLQKNIIMPYHLIFEEIYGTSVFIPDELRQDGVDFRSMFSEKEDEQNYRQSRIMSKRIKIKPCGFMIENIQLALGDIGNLSNSNWEHTHADDDLYQVDTMPRRTRRQVILEIQAKCDTHYATSSKTIVS